MKNISFFLQVVRPALLASFLVGGTIPIWADVKLPAIFGDHMVLQQDGKIPVWGTAAPGEEVKVTVGTNSASATADQDGHWRVDLAPLSSTSTPTLMTVAGKNTLTFQDVLVGEVWLASGQSNMEFGVGGVLNAKDVIAAANHPLIRLFHVGNTPGIIPKSDVTGKWEICTPETVPGFSAVAYLFGVELQNKYNRPVGLIESSWGGTPAQTWISLEVLKTIPSEAGGVDQMQKMRDAFPKDAAAQTALVADYQAKLKDWQTNVDAPYQDIIKKWQADTDAAKAAGQPLPPRPNESANRPQSPDGEGGQPSVLFSGMIAPLIPYALKGALWYQGESNAGGDGQGYDTLLEALITDWRTRWAQGDFTFLIVQIANNDPRYPYPVDSGWAGVRAGEEKTVQTLPKTALASAIDLGCALNIHPPDKQDVAKRLAVAAQHVTYGENVVCTGPTFASMIVDGNKVRIKYTDIGTGLTIGTSPWYSGEYPRTTTTELVGFAVAGDDKKWSWAKAQISGDDVVVSSDQVPNPVAVRYGWANNPEVNLYNKEGFPAIPFKTDTWPFVAPSGPPPPPPPPPAPPAPPPSPQAH
jgi:sialate O-acetylesterase